MKPNGKPRKPKKKKINDNKIRKFPTELKKTDKISKY